MKQRQSKKREKRKESTIKTWPVYIILVVLFVLYIIYQRVAFLSILFGAALFFTIVALVVLEFFIGVHEEGYKKNLIEIGITIGAVVVIWLLLEAILQTNYPLDVVPSCSMLPQLHRGDMVLLHGVSNITQIKAPVVLVSHAAYQSMLSNVSSEYLSCVAYKQVNNRIVISQVVGPGYSIGLFRSSQSGGAIVPQGYQNNSLITYTCGTRQLTLQNGGNETIAYTTAVTVGDKTIVGDRNNSVVVYKTTQQDFFYSLGDTYIVHRAYLVISDGQNYYVLTKGDNNPGLDIQYGNRPVNLTNIEGQVVASVPYIGYLKLILSNNFNQPAGCNSTIAQQ